MRLGYFKRDARADHFVTFVIVTRGEFEDGEWKGHDEWGLYGAGRVRIDCAGQTNPKELPNEKSRAVRLQNEHLAAKLRLTLQAFSAQLRIDHCLEET